MGDGGFWHNGLTSGAGRAVFIQNNGVLMVVDDAHTGATGVRGAEPGDADIPGVCVYFLYRSKLCRFC